MKKTPQTRKDTRLVVTVVFVLITLLIIVITGRTESGFEEKTTADSSPAAKKKDTSQNRLRDENRQTPDTREPEKQPDASAEKSDTKEAANTETPPADDSHGTDPDETTPLSDTGAEQKPLPSETDKDGFIRGKILPRKGIESALMALEGVKLHHAMAVSNVLRFNFDMRYLIAGEDIRIKLTDDGEHVQQFEYQPNAIVSHILTRSEKTGELTYRKQVKPHEIRYRIIEGAVNGTLNMSLAARDDVTANIRSTANNVLGCIVSFRTDARKGDSFSILVAEQYYDDKKAGRAKLLHIAYEGPIAGKNEAFLYEDEDPESAYNAHYTITGKALIPSSLRLPVDRVRVTSPFGYRRHPVTGRRSFHNGVDYGGAIGSPVYAIAKGEVVQTTRTTYGGKKIVIRHMDGTRSYYLHLHRILVRPGQFVKPRERIAQIGRTGRVTGAHLHLSIKSPRGKWQDPLRKKMIATPQLKSRRMARYQKQKAHIEQILSGTEIYHTLRALLDSGPQPVQVLKKFRKYRDIIRKPVPGSSSDS